MGVGGLFGHVRVVSAALHTILLRHLLGLGRVTVLGDDTALIDVEQGHSGLALQGLVAPGIDHVHIDHCVRVDGLGAQGEGVDAGAGLSVIGVVGGHIADGVVLAELRLHPGGDPGQVAGLVDAAEVVVEVGVVGHIAGAVGEDHVGILLRLVGHRVDIAEGDAEDDVRPLVDHGIDGVGHRGIVIVWDVVHHDQVGGVQAQRLHGGGDPVVVLIGVAGHVVLAGDVDGAHLDAAAASRAVAPGSRGAAAIAPGTGGRAAALVTAAAGGQRQAHGHSQSQCKDLLQFCFLLKYGSFPTLYIKTGETRL